jgi:hypothetical protein
VLQYMCPSPVICINNILASCTTNQSNIWVGLGYAVHKQRPTLTSTIVGNASPFLVQTWRSRHPGLGWERWILH